MREEENNFTMSLKGATHKLKTYRKAFFAVIYPLIIVAAIAVLCVTLWTPVLRAYGNSMTPTLNEGEVLISLSTTKVQTGDIIAFYYNNKILLKRVIAKAGDEVNITEEGTVYINGEELKEPYLTTKVKGEADITFPYQVPEGRLFVLGDNREVSLDSRLEQIGCVTEEQILGKVIFRVWPFNKLGGIK